MHAPLLLPHLTPPALNHHLFPRTAKHQSPAAPAAPAPLRKLLQRFPYPTYNNQWAASRTAATLTQQSIRNAVDFGPSFGATQAATTTGAVTAATAAYNPCALTGWGPGCGGWYGGWGRRRMQL